MLDIYDPAPDVIDYDDFIDPPLDNEVIFSQEFEPEITEVGFYSDGHLEVSSMVFEMDEVCEKVLKTLWKNPDGVTGSELEEAIFGGYKNYTQASPAQRTRLDSTIEYLAGIELNTQTNLLNLYTLAERPGVVFFEPTFTAKYFRKPYNEEAPGEINPQKEVAISGSANTLSELQHEIARVISDVKNHDTNHEGRIGRKAFFKALTGSETPPFDQEVALNKAVDEFNQWLLSRGLEVQIRRFTTLQGPALQVDNTHCLDTLLDDIVREEEVIVADFERERAQIEADMVAWQAELAQQAAIKVKPVKRLATNVKKPIEKRAVHPIARSFMMPATITERDCSIASEIGQEIGMEVGEVLAVRLLLGRALSNNSLPTGKEQVGIIRFLQAARAHISSNAPEGSRNYRLKSWSDAALGVMIIRYEKRIEAMAQRHLGGRINTERYAELKHVGVLGLDDGINKFDTERDEAGGYLALRINGQMVDHLRKVAWGSRAEEGRVRMLSLDSPSQAQDQATSVTLLDTILIPEPGTSAQFASVENSMTLVNLLADGLQRIRKRTGSGNNQERDIRITVLHFGVESLMGDEDLAVYRSLQEGTRAKQGIALAGIATHFGLTESRASQIVTKITGALHEVLPNGAEDLVA